MNHDQEKDKQKFLDAIKDNRYDGELRLVYSDWLEERGLDDEALTQRKWTKEKQEAEDWLREFASRCGDTCVEGYGTDYYDEGGTYHEGEERWEPITYEMVIEAGWHVIKEGYGLTQHGSERARDLFSSYRDEREGDQVNLEKFWECWELVTGHKASSEDKESVPFGCSC